ncbi:Long-chain-fatty-acid--CoA ligase [[Actinomadura] parvosata subsp. kistnae]|uniref:Acyl-CoA synthetase n=1 Tax=[Actinomadura] parvosata subsp. kistnae TaxID=1909395 RepID=A0A1U9ZT36_9ACTN|nr:AMP-dependent synthetase/ligase [Nonomuraea sp. ATCC 55076]AQZ61114.1 long-chain fatty acid--CoA ligase [Nonomuraea sp. ATCC 55076]SPL87509.1 Long-chain-fatty-acid--CoA ligase [Actinomadura parvosata subsp. kistnae]
MGEVLEVRAEIERQIAGRTVCEQLARAAEEHHDAPAYSDPEGDGWRTLTYGQARERVLEIAAAFVALGLEPGEAVALMMVNRSEHVLADLGAVHAGGVGCTVYSTFAPDQIAFVAGDVGARYAVLGGPADLARWEPVLDRLDGLRRIIMLDGAPAGDRFMAWDDFLALGRERLAADPAQVETRLRAVAPGDVATVLYTSGTTGTPKGVPLTHANIFYEVAATDRLTALPMRGTQISYLTYAHIAERILSLYLPLVKVSHVHFCTDLANLGATLGQVRPMMFFGVPRVWEKMMARLLAVLATQPEEQQAAVREAMAAGVAYVEAGQYGHTITPEIQAAYDQADASLLSIIRGMIGFDRAEWTATGAAPLPDEVQRFYAGLGLKVIDVYGMTETTGAFTGNSPACYRLGTVGRAEPGVEVRIAEDGELLTRSPLNTAGYLNRPQATAELIDADGWLHTGDIGTVDDDGFYRVVDRKKELIITAGGENISPAEIENHLKQHSLIGQALAYGDNRPHPVAVLTLDPEVAPGWAQARGITFGSLAELAEHPDVLAEVEAAVQAANAKLARVQQVKKWALLGVEWTAETEELTPSLKLKRRIIHTKYADIIEGLYGRP